MDDQQYSRYIDQESAVVKRPEGPGWSDPFGDGVWRSSWFYGSLLIISAKDRPLYENIRDTHGVTIEDGREFLLKFRELNRGGHQWRLPKNATQKFSRDQLTPLLFFLAACKSYDSE